ncbi:MAG: hypothetical protein GC180_02695 [Bacteroidetes bacterium]|nr:hypothetical protein [Bacteroidota bacterium]
MLRKTLFTLSIGLILLSCHKNKENPAGNQQPIKSTSLAPDSGFYNPGSYFPLKWGAEWIYLHDNQDIEKVTCGPQFLDSMFDHGNGIFITYEAHRLNSDYQNFTLPSSFTAGLNEKYWNERRIRNDFCNYHIGIIQEKMWCQQLKSGSYYPSFLCTGEYPGNDVMLNILIYSDSVQPGYTKVLKTVQTRLKYELSQDTTSTGYMYELPLKLTHDAEYTVCWFAKGIGLIQREYYQRDTLKDRMILQSYVIPQ